MVVPDKVLYQDQSGGAQVAVGGNSPSDEPIGRRSARISSGLHNKSTDW
jgi:hypothetical protein